MITIIAQHSLYKPSYVTRTHQFVVLRNTKKHTHGDQPYKPIGAQKIKPNASALSHSKHFKHLSYDTCTSVLLVPLCDTSYTENPYQLPQGLYSTYSNIHQCTKLYICSYLYTDVYYRTYTYIIYQEKKTYISYQYIKHLIYNINIYILTYLVH